MKSKASFFNFSPTLIQENFRRFWAAPVLGFLVYFLSGIFPILMTYSKIDDLAYYIKLTLNNQQPFFVIVHLLMPIAAAVIVLRYLQQSSSVTYMHALPLSRAKLFNSNFISGWLMCMIPIVVTAVLLFVLSTPTHEIVYYYQDNRVLGPDIFTNAAIAHWLWQSVLVVTFIYAVSIFAGMVVGNSVLQMLLAATLCFILPAINLALSAYFEQYLWGYVTKYESALDLFPWLEMLRGEPFSTGLTVAYLAVIVLLVVFSAVLNYRRKLEKAGDGVVFGFMVPVLCYLIAFLGMSLFGFYFYAMSDQKYAYMYAGMAAGAILFFIIARMLVYKTPRVFNKQSLKSFVAYGLIAVLFVCALAFDLTNFEDRVPDANNYTGASLQADTILGVNSQEYERYQSSYFGQGEVHFTDPAALDIIRQYHAYIVDNKDKFKDKPVDDYYYDYYSSASKITYYNDSGRYLARSYVLPYILPDTEKYMAALYESKDFKDFYSLSNVKLGVPSKITVSYLNTNYEMNIGKSDFKAFIAMLDKDFAARSYEEHLANNLYYAQATLEFPDKDGESSFQTLTVDIKQSDVNTIQWLEARGYAQLRAQAAAAVTQADVDYAEWSEVKSEDSSTQRSNSSEYVKTITDRTQIAYILEHGQSYVLPGTQAYYTIMLQNSQQAYTDDIYFEGRYSYYPEQAMKETEEDVVALYFTPETAPDFIKR